MMATTTFPAVSRRFAFFRCPELPGDDMLVVELFIRIARICRIFRSLVDSRQIKAALGVLGEKSRRFAFFRCPELPVPLGQKRGILYKRSLPTLTETWLCRKPGQSSKQDVLRDETVRG
ncbi:hypothetical protein C0Q70_05026 [Pomacea canaliculata]|uniref:Uncharacterized protein n=1 Tax=Pomacea canaliculata TaxID=400727 RepID=A0A2T7PJZ9_POMCA|nr:hypothetical protein C0Q70_05026 [Pomacea canaliculata]